MMTQLEPLHKRRGQVREAGETREAREKMHTLGRWHVFARTRIYSFQLKFNWSTRRQVSTHPARHTLEIVSADNKLPLGPGSRVVSSLEKAADDYICLIFIFSLSISLYFISFLPICCGSFAASIYHSACTLSPVFGLPEAQTAAFDPAKLWRRASGLISDYGAAPPGGDNYDTLVSSCRLAAVKVLFYWLRAECGPKCGASFNSESSLARLWSSGNYYQPQTKVWS